MRLANQVALISGAGGPMGLAIAKRFASEGARVVITDISASR
jgi:3-oxoacyl-[acyl-carrier protein] reductase